MLSTLRIVIVEDELMIRSMLRLFCEREPSWHVIGEVGDCQSACSVVEAMRPDLVLLDLGLGAESGVDCLPHLLRLGASRVIVLTGNEDPDLHQRALAAGASRVLRKGDPSEKIMGVLRDQATEIFSEKTSISSSVTTPVATIQQDSITRLTSLTERERHIIELLAGGSRDDDIAVELDVSTSTLHHALTIIYQKLGVANRVELVVYAFQNQLALPQ